MMTFHLTDCMLLLLTAVFPDMHIMRPKNALNPDYLSIKTSQSMRGLCAILILFHHISQEVEKGSLFYGFSYIGFLVVGVFFFLSGYGLTKSYCRKVDYQKGFLLHRLPSVFIPYTLIFLIYWVWYTVRYGRYTVEDMWWNLKNGSLLVFNSWFIVAITVIYLCFYISMLLCRKNRIALLTVNAFLIVIYVLVCRYLKLGEWWYNSIHVAWLGMVYAVVEPKILALIQKKQLLIYGAWFFLSCAVFAYTVHIFTCNQTGGVRYFAEFLSTVFFMGCVLLLALKLRFGNRVLEYLGEISLELYLIHGLFISVYRSELFYIQNDMVFCFVILMSAFPVAALLHFVDSRLLFGFRKLTKRSHHKRKRRREKQNTTVS